MNETIESLQKRLDFYEKDPEKRAYFSLVRIVNMQVDYLNSFNIKEKIGGKASEDATFARTQGIWENLPKMIASLNELKAVLRIKPEDEQEEVRRMTSPESVAEELGDYKKQDV